MRVLFFSFFFPLYTISLNRIINFGFLSIQQKNVRVLIFGLKITGKYIFVKIALLLVHF